MEQILKTLQDLQMKAFKNGIHTFEINARRYKDEGCKGIVVAIFLTGSYADDDYGAFYFYNDADPADNFRSLNNLKAFIGEE